MRDPRKSRILGDATVLCPRCGFVQRYLVGHTAVDHAACPDCGTELIRDCPACHAPIESAMQVECRECGTALRDAELFGVAIRRKPEPRHSS
jgi:predicted RNA-binding Zn-ribbon protein involved in translation (DUF1610 family)